ncbi:chorismate synthase [Diplodia corticola]|uniref:Chorismate synthase n=1 Tax=Diplodia corticola TaxID=236234 RepID=A0A1J9R447_9PEZI|nr:chorismate synthase [Diplodia corticola]OJD34994.1 chorismate synthase [Diplodia corticola]
MVAITLSGLRSLLIFFGPMLLPKAIQLCRSIRASPRNPHGRVRPIPPAVAASLNLLYAFAILAFAASLPYFAPENVFQATSSRLQIPTDTLFVRLGKLRPLSAVDEALRSKFVNIESRLLYLAYGPSVLATCPFCTSDEPSSYFYYALPSIIAPHLLHLVVLGLVTSSVISGSEGARWRTWAASLGVVLTALEVWAVGTYDYTQNATALRLGDLEPFYWRIRTLRYIAFALMDGLLGYAMYLTSTNRWLVIPPTISERIEENTRMVESLKGKLSMLAAMKNTVARDKGLRERNLAYWVDEGQYMGEIFEDREVVDGMQNALERANVEMIENQAGGMADGIVSVIENMRKGTGV